MLYDTLNEICTAIWLPHRLVGLCATLVASVCSYSHHRLHLSGAGHNTPHHHQLADAVCLHVTDNLGLGCGRGFEVHLTRE